MRTKSILQYLDAIFFLLVSLLSDSLYAENIGDARVDAICHALKSSIKPSDIVVSVNTTPINHRQLQLAIEHFVKRGKVKVNDAERPLALNDMINQEILAQMAIKLKLQDEPEFRSKLDFMIRELLADAYLSHYQSNTPVSDAQLHKIYEEQKDQLWPKEYKLREIVLKDESSAREIIDQIDSIKTFSQLAHEHSISPSSEAGGFLGWVRLSRLPKEVRSNVSDLEEDHWSQEPVLINDQYHIYMVEKTRQPGALPFEKVKGAMQHYAQQLAVSEHIQQLRDKALVTYP